jgi:type IV pilus assembly protein PilB
MAGNRLGELLVRHKILTQEQVNKAIAEHKAHRERLVTTLSRLKLISEEDLATFLARQYSAPSINLEEFEVDTEVTKLLSAEVVQKYHLMPISRTGSTLIIAMSDPSNIFAIDDIKFMTGHNVEVVVATDSAIKKAIDKYYDQSDSLAEVMNGLDDIDLEVIEEEDEIDVNALQVATEEACESDYD